LDAIHGHNSIFDYDYATCGINPNVSYESNNKLDYVAFFILNPTETHGGTSIAPIKGITNFGMAKKLKIANEEYSIECWTVMGIRHTQLNGNGAIFIHEFAHSLLGGNAFHTSGGDHLGNFFTKTFIYKQYGYG